MKLATKLRMGNKYHMPRYVGISTLLFLKPIVDIFYSIQILDYILLALAIGILVSQKGRLKRTNHDLLVCGIAVLYCGTLIRDLKADTLVIFIKISSAMIMYFIGHRCSGNVPLYIESAAKGFSIALVINVFAIYVLGIGTKQWGDADTLTGLYFFKTDMAVALLSLIIFLLISRDVSLGSILLGSIACIMLFLTNSRVALLILALIVGCGVLFQLETRGYIKRILKIDVKLLALAGAMGVLSLFALRYLGKTEFFTSRGFISVDFSKFSDLLSGANTQGRTEIWRQILERFGKASIFEQMFGISMNSSIAKIMKDSHVSAHSLYFSVLYSIGYCGIAVLALQIISIINRLNTLKNRQLFYACIMFMIVYFGYGISVNTNEFTNYSWLYMFFVGLVFNDRADFTDASKKNRAGLWGIMLKRLSNS